MNDGINWFHEIRFHFQFKWNDWFHIKTLVVLWKFVHYVQNEKVKNQNFLYLTLTGPGLTGLIWSVLSTSFNSWQYNLILLAADENFFLYLQKIKNFTNFFNFISRKIAYPLGWWLIAIFIPWTHKLVPTNNGGWTIFCL